MNLFGTTSTTIRETCCCGAEFSASGAFAITAALGFREQHQWHQSKTRPKKMSPNEAKALYIRRLKQSDPSPAVLKVIAEVEAEMVDDLVSEWHAAEPSPETLDEFLMRSLGWSREQVGHWVRTGEAR